NTFSSCAIAAPTNSRERSSAGILILPVTMAIPCCPSQYNRTRLALRSQVRLLRHTPQESDHHALDHELRGGDKVWVQWVLRFEKRFALINNIPFQGRLPVD